MWLCKYCGMQNEDWENECFVCGKPQKEPDPVVVKEEKKTPPAVREAGEPAPAQPALSAFAAAFEKAVPVNEEYEPIAQEAEADYADFEEIASDYAAFVDAAPDYSEYTEAVSVSQPQEEPDASLYDDSYIEAEADMKIFNSNRENIFPAAEPAPPVQHSPFVVADAAVAPVYSAPPETPKTTFSAEPKKTTDFDLQQFLSQIKQGESDNITEEIRKKQEDRKNQHPAAAPQNPPCVQTDVPPRALKKQKKAEQRRESVAMFSKVTVKISRIILAVFLLIAAAFLAVCVLRGHGENIPYVIDEIFYAFELQLRGFLESMQF
ncbi:MAG: hypothetical protein IKJ63_10700 [Clostridia bacterium]|nr:hypothetical protein [Clostridia bacterium]